MSSEMLNKIWKLSVFLVNQVVGFRFGFFLLKDHTEHNVKFFLSTEHKSCVIKAYVFLYRLYTFFYYILYYTGDKKQLSKSLLKVLQSLQLSSGFLQSKLLERNTHFSSASVRLSGLISLLFFLTCLHTAVIPPGFQRVGEEGN